MKYKDLKWKGLKKLKTMNKEALFYEVDHNKVNCKLCPHYCKLSEGQVGFCSVRKALKDEEGNLKLYSLNYEKITSIAIDPIEKKPLYHFYPGKNILSVGSFGCNFKCSFCQNYTISQEIPDFKQVKSNELVDIIKSIENNIGIAFTYNEPSIWYEYVLETSKLVKKELKDTNKVVLVTNGYINEEPLKNLLPYVDALNIDLKGDESYYNRLCKGRLEPVKNTIKIAHDKGCHVEVTTLLIEEENTSSEILEMIGDFLSSLDKDIPLHLSRAFPKYKMNVNPTGLEELSKAYRNLKDKLNYVYVGNISEKEKLQILNKNI